jgi:hypothetical protein
MKKNAPQKRKITDVILLEELLLEIESEAALLQDLQLDILTLDTSWVEQPALSFKWNQLSNRADYCLKSAEKSVKDLQASVYLAKREELTADKIKFTEALLNSLVAEDAEIQEKQEDILYLQYICNLLVSAKKAIDDRRRALEGLVSLHSTQYFTNGHSNPLLEELGDNKVQEQHTAVLENNQRLRKLRSKRKGERNESK